MAEVDVRNFTKKSIASVFLKNIAKRVFEEEKISDNTALDIAFIGPKRMSGLNRRYRGENKVTDVLSFGKDQFSEKSGGIVGFGEIIICPEYVALQAKTVGHSFKKELAVVFIHGILHLLGYEHENGGSAAENMRRRERKILRIINKSQGRN